MWVFISRQLRVWLLLAASITTLLHVIQDALEKRSGATTITRILERIERLGGKPSQPRSARMLTPDGRRRRSPRQQRSQ